MRRRLLTIALPLLYSVGLQTVLAGYDAALGDDDDLTFFYSRPDIRAPKLNVTVYDDKDLEEGFLFIAPYASVKQNQQLHAQNYYQPCQTGPVIYDKRGELIWSGACNVGLPNQNTFDFRVFHDGAKQYLSMILYGYSTDHKGHALILDSSYAVVNRVTNPVEFPSFNMHEFNVIDNGSKALEILWRPQYVDVRALGLEKTDAGWIADMGFRELELKTGKMTFEWWARDRVDVVESTAPVAKLDGAPPSSWNWFHMNSVNKNDDGDYIVSSRFTDCIYKISGKDGSVVWRLGGNRSSFDLRGFNFSRQHDAQWVSHDDDTEIVSFLDNAGDSEEYNTANTSSALIVKLNKQTNPMTAEVLERIWRPDDARSDLRGNFQILPNSNRLVCWSENSYITEHSADKEGHSLVMEARFKSKRFVTYRAYKFNFTGTPTEPPDLVGTVHGPDRASSVTTINVSWNGATEVASWEFSALDDETGESHVLGSTERTGFETTFYSRSYQPLVYATAKDKEGTVLGTSATYRVAPLLYWDRNVGGSDVQPNRDTSDGNRGSAHSADGDAEKDEL